MNMQNLKILGFAAVTSMMVACGGGGTEEAPAAQEPAQTEAPAEAESMESEAEVVEFVIEANDQMQYNLKSMEVKAGQTVRVTLKNVGEMPKEAMGHNWTLLAKGVNSTEYGTEAISEKDNGYQVTGREDDVIIHTAILGPGEEETVEFTLNEVGIYKYICTFPGHAGLMNGTFLVK